MPSASDTPEVRLERNSLSGKNYLPRRSARSGRVPAHIGEALPPMAKGNPEGSPSDPVTTDPKGEAGREAALAAEGCDLQHAGPHQDKAAYGESPAGPTFGPQDFESCATTNDKVVVGSRMNS
jgi:hypothetical protein